VENWWTEPFRLAELLRALVEGGVDFVVVGGVAVISQASPRFTKDLDIVYATTPENLERLGAVLVKLGATLHGIDEQLPFVPDARTLHAAQMLCLSTPLGRVDLLADPAGAPPYERLRARADVVGIEDLEVRIASIDDLLAMKRASGRTMDLVDIESLEIAKRRLGRRRRN
jgi:hypothetical protein